MRGSPLPAGRTSCSETVGEKEEEKEITITMRKQQQRNPNGDIENRSVFMATLYTHQNDKYCLHTICL